MTTQQQTETKTKTKTRCKLCGEQSKVAFDDTAGRTAHLKAYHKVTDIFYLRNFVMTKFKQEVEVKRW